jgi:RNA polymerase sigma-70 factor (ECF subfamily)
VRENTLTPTTRTTREAPASSGPPQTQAHASRGNHSFDDARDRALLAAHRAGDRGALSDLLESYQDRLFSICMRMVNCPETSADLTQEAMVKIIQGIDAFAGRSKLSTWIIRVTMNVCLTHRRRMRLRNHLSIELPMGARGGETDGSALTIGDSLPCEKETGSFEAVASRETRSRLYRAMERLEANARAILILRDVQGLDYGQIAEVLDVPTGTVKSRLFRARASLRDAIERTADSRV